MGLIAELMIKPINRFLSDLKILAKLRPFLDGLQKWLGLSLILGFASSVIESFAVSLVMFFIFKTVLNDDFYFGNKMLDDFFQHIDAMTEDNVLIIWGTIIGILILKTLIVGSYNLLSDHIVNTIHHRIRSGLFEKYMSLPYKEISKLDYGTMTNALQVECWYITEIIYSVFRIVITLCAISVYLVVIAVFSWQVALVLLILGTLIKLALAGLKLPIRRIGYQVTQINEELTAHMYTRMQALKTIRAHGLEKRETDAFVALSNAVAKAFTRMSWVETYIRPINDITVLIMIAFLVWFSTALGNPVTVTATIIALLYRLQPHLNGLEGEFINLHRSQGPLEAVLTQLEAEDIRTQVSATLEMPESWSVMRFENVGFAYDTNIILKDINFELHRCQTLAVKGESGIGKTTLVNLFLKLTEPTNGTIWLDDLDFNDIKRQAWLCGVAAAGQDFELPDGTLRENLTLGRNISDELIMDALEIAEIKDFVSGLPEGLETKVGERGVRLSGGQRQRIVLARAIAAHPDVLIMDEATSAVSIPVEKNIYKNITAARPDMTIILITHRNIPDGFADLQINI
tara:strand:+ start:8464 stop:10182 length:1719 start_codon:yes stop_codon:yes gene_type:complete